MNRSELIDAMVEKKKSSVKTKAQAKEVLDLVQECVMEALGKGEEIALAGFGTFKPVKRAAHTGRNPQTGETIHVKESNSVSFRPAKAMKESVNK